MSSESLDLQCKNPIPSRLQGALAALAAFSSRISKCKQYFNALHKKNASTAMQNGGGSSHSFALTRAGSIKRRLKERRLIIALNARLYCHFSKLSKRDGSLKNALNASLDSTGSASSSFLPCFPIGFFCTSFIVN